MYLLFRCLLTRVCLLAIITKKHTCYSKNKGALTLCVELGGVFAESLEEHLLPEQLQESGEGRRRLLIVVHLLLCALVRTAQKNTHLVLLTQLRGKHRENKQLKNCSSLL